MCLRNFAVFHIQECILLCEQVSDTHFWRCYCFEWFLVMSSESIQEKNMLQHPVLPGLYCSSRWHGQSKPRENLLWNSTQRERITWKRECLCFWSASKTQRRMSHEAGLVNTIVWILIEHSHCLAMKSPKLNFVADYDDKVMSEEVLGRIYIGKDRKDMISIQTFFLAVLFWWISKKRLQPGYICCWF